MLAAVSFICSTSGCEEHNKLGDHLRRLRAEQSGEERKPLPWLPGVNDQGEHAVGKNNTQNGETE
jgi:hypothetical protein